MKNKLWFRLAMSFLVVALVVVSAVAWVVFSSVEARFSQYINTANAARFGGNLVDELERYYLENGTWEGAQTLLPTRSGGNGGMQGAQLFIADTNGIIVVSTSPTWRAQSMNDIGQIRKINLTLNGQNVGWFGEQTPGTVALNKAEDGFLSDVTVSLLITAVVGGGLVFALGIAVAYTLTRPLEHLTRQVTDWRMDSHHAPMIISGTDEIQRLGQAFNALSQRLVLGETQRQQMSADVAHELRTPVTVMRGHLEAMLDGIYPLDTAHLATVYDQVLHLARLVEDLRLLTLAEDGRLPLNMSSLELSPFIEQMVQRFLPLMQDRQITLAAHIPAALPPVHADPLRLQQVFDNLLSNALRHTPEGGRVDIRATVAGDKVVVTLVNPVAVALDSTQLSHLFDRFWRGESARQRDMGGSGLGLAITRELLRLQGASISAENLADGLCFTVRLATVTPVKSA